MSNTVLRFIIRVSSPTTVTAFTPYDIEPHRVTFCLQNAAARLNGATVAPAKVVLVADGDSFVSGTGGLLRFAEPQTTETLAFAAKAIGESLISNNFGLYEELANIP